MKNYIKLLLVFLVLPFIALAQEEDSTAVKDKEKLERPAFESATIIDNPSNVLFSKNALEVQMQHRFGTIDKKNDMVGFWGAANIRIGLSYAVHERLTIGFGTTKDGRLQDFNWKAALLRQTQSNSMPVSVTYFGNFVIDARSKDNINFVQDRYSYFNQIIIAKRFTPNFSAQIAPSISHFNVVDNVMKNDMIAVAIGGRYKISPQTAIIADYSQPLTKFYQKNPHPGISLGVEFATSGHAFQIFATNYHGIVPQQNYVKNSNDIFNGDILIGFNITRVYNF